MQQPMAQQPDQMGTQQPISQQMVLCPVRLVYETQILVQPGDHIQPNQTFFINPQNPPPWMQNSLQSSLQQRQPIQNQVVYVHHQLPGNMMPAIQQPMDQNQLYLQQNFPNFQIQQQMLAQNPQDMRPTMQLANIMPNMVQNIQTSVPNERPVQNRQMQPNPQLIQNQIAVNRPVHTQVVNPALEVQGQVYMRPQMHQQNLQRPMMNVNHMQQNMQQQTMTNHQNVGPNTGQTFAPNTSRAGPMNTVRTSMANNMAHIQAAPKVREVAPSNMEKTVNSPIGNVAPNVRNFVPNYYRPIQPRPQIIHNAANAPKASQHVPVQTVQHTPVYNHDKNNSHQNPNYAIIQELNNPTINRKRKSESPDDVQKKLASTSSVKHNYNTQTITNHNYNPPQETVTKHNYNPAQETVTKHNYNPAQETVTKHNYNPAQETVTKHNYNSPQETVTKHNYNPTQESVTKRIYNPAQESITKRNYNTTLESISKTNYRNIECNITATKIVNEMGTNTSPVHRPKLNPQFQVNNSIQIVKCNDDSEVNASKELISLQDKDKLIRNTVYTQARGRVLQDKSDEMKLQHMEMATEITDEKPGIPQGIVARVEIELKPRKVEFPNSITITPIEKDVIIKIEKVNNKDQIEIHKTNVQETVKCDEISVEKVDVIEKDDSVEIVASEIEKMDEENQEESLVDDKTTEKHEVIDILTHVVDGYVIQESNIAFPIRKPLKEKTLHTNLKSEEKEIRDLIKESMREELKSTSVDIPLLPFHYLLLESAKEEKEKAEEEKEKEREEAKTSDDPFSQLQQTTVKTWTVDDLSTYLMQFNWKDTVSLLQEHEIDGESLFLVSKPQLLTIGVTEEHADAICEFVKC